MAGVNKYYTLAKEKSFLVITKHKKYTALET